MTKRQIVVTHDGKFHADEVMAVATLQLALGTDALDILRSRDREIVSKADFAVDVGHIYDPALNRYDHHQSEGAGVRENGIPYGSFGLLWKHFGEKVCGSKSVADEVESVVVLPIDAVDNGVAIIQRATEEASPYDFHDAIDVFNPHLSESLAPDEQFLTVLEIARAVLEREITKARFRQEDDHYVREAYEHAEDKRIIILERPASVRFLRSVPEPLFSITPSVTDTKWTANAIRIDPEFFEYRAYFPATWAGKEQNDLALVSDVPDAVFCHRHLFIAVAESKEGALALAKLALEA